MKIKNLINSGTNVFTLTALELLTLGVSSKDCLDFLNDVKKNTPEYHKNLSKLKEEKTLLNLTDSDFEAFKQEQTKWLQDFNNARNLCNRMFNFLNNEALNMLDGASQKYYKKTSFSLSSYPAVDCTLDDLKRAKAHLILKKKQKEDDAIKAGQLVTPEMIEAIEYLKDQNLYPNQDYQPKDSLKKAFEVKLNKLIEAESGQEQEIDFCECHTWVAGERRCSCGNVRVYWDYYPSSEKFKELIIYPAKD